MKSPRNGWKGLWLAVAALGLGGGLQLASAQSLTDGTAITDPIVLRELDARRRPGNQRGMHGFGLRQVLQADGSPDAVLLNDELFALPAMLPVRQAIDRDIEAYAKRHRTDIVDATADGGNQDRLQLFDRSLLYSARTRFVLAGIVNRMDRAFVSPTTCGEIRLIYRLIRTEPRADEPSRLPMTLNVVLAATDAVDGVGSSGAVCAKVARRWLAMRNDTPKDEALVRRLAEADGPLAVLQTHRVIRLELNVQVGHQPRAKARAFRTDYLMKAFRYDRVARRFDEAPLENQIDRDRILADDGLKAELVEWLLQPQRLQAFDRGTLLVPDRFLARSVIAATPAGFVASSRQPEYGLVQSSAADKQAAFNSRDVVAALRKAEERGVVFTNIRSVAGFERRLNDMTCAGCHQTRGIGGFHFPGVASTSSASTEAVNVPVSPHFVGDQPRRRNILEAFRDKRRPDFSRGFASRPQLRGDTTLIGTEYDDGWGAHCYDARAEGAADRSFVSWTCAKGLSCQAIGEAGRTERMGMCFVGPLAGESDDERR